MSDKFKWFAISEKTESGSKWRIVEDVTSTRVVGEISDDDRFVPSDGVVATSELHACTDKFLNFMRFLGTASDPGKNEGCRIELFPY